MISWLPFSYFESGGIRPAFGVIYTLFLSLLAIWFWDKAKCSVSVKWLAVLVLCILSVFGDWAMFDVLYALTFFRYRENPREKWLTFSGITLVCCVSMLGNEPIWSGLFQLGIFLVIPLIQYCYNGESGSKKPFHKWFFLCVLSAAPAGAGDSSLGGVCVNEAGQAAGTAFRRSGKAVYGRYFPK